MWPTVLHATIPTPLPLSMASTVLVKKRPRRITSAPFFASPLVQAANYQNRPAPITKDPSFTKTILRKGSRVNEEAWNKLQDAQRRLLLTQDEYQELSEMVYRFVVALFPNHISFIVSFQ